jgi:hypothetical protein
MFCTMYNLAIVKLYIFICSYAMYCILTLTLVIVGTIRPGVDSASKNEYQVTPGGKNGRCVRVTTLPPS